MIARALDFAIGGLEVVFAVVAFRSWWRSRRSSPWLAVLVAFFVLRGTERCLLAASKPDASLAGLLLDAMLVAVLVLMLVGMKRAAGASEAALEAARAREAEYRRALVDYRRLARHRLANPLTSIIGGVRLLEELKPGNQDLRRQLLSLIGAEARRLETISLDPDDGLEVEERGLRPHPARVGPGPSGGFDEEVRIP